MNANNLKLAWRAAWKSKLFTSLNIFGLAVGFAGFILAYAYINRETSYDAWNTRYDDIYLIGKEHEGAYSDMTPADLSPAIQAKLPEIELAGRVAQAPYECPFLSDNDIFFVKRWLGADKSIGELFQIQTNGFSIAESDHPQIGIFSKEVGQKLFPDQPGPFSEPKAVALFNEDFGIYEYIHAIGDDSKLSNLSYDYIGFKDDIMEENATPLFQTYIRVKPKSNLTALSDKINQVYQQDVVQKAQNNQIAPAKDRLYLEPLKNLHLKPKHGNPTGHYIVVALGGLSIVILVLACINFANLMLVQAQQRAREIGIKKIFGVSRMALAAQFLFEVFIQCLTAALLALFFVLISWNAMKTYFQYDFASFEFNTIILLQLGLAVFATTLISGAYPSLMLSGYRPVAILKGNFQSGHKTAALRNVMLTFQFVIAFLFISTMLIVGRQLNYMKHGDKGFSTDQVLYIKNMAIYDSPADFEAVRNQLKAIHGVQYATVVSNIPGGNRLKQYDFEIHSKSFDFDHIAVDLEYFETLEMTTLAGRLFSETTRPDLNQAVLNSAAAQAIGMRDPIGQTIRQDGITYQVVGLVKDSKMEGFEQAVKPTVYTQQSIGTLPEGVPKVEILVKLATGDLQKVLRTLEDNWATINPKDGQHFNYEFLNQKYAHLHADQEKLKNAFTAFTYLILLVTLMGLFAMSAYAISLREKEVGIRKVLGADIRQIILLLNGPFIRLVIVAILIATPIAWWSAGKWLDTFAYRADIPWWLFTIAAVFALTLAFITVSYQAIKAAFTNPVDTLRNE